MVTIRSASSAMVSTPRRASGVSRAMGRMRAMPPSASIRAASAKVLDATICDGPGASPGITNSSPVAIRATVGRRDTTTSARFIAASKARSLAVRRRGVKVSPALKS